VVLLTFHHDHNTRHWFRLEIDILTFRFDAVFLVREGFMQITFLYYEDCPSHEQALARLQQVIAEEGVDAEIEIIKVETEEQAQELRFIGSPTILVNGEDIVPPPPESPYNLTCRAYILEDGRVSPLPSPEMIRRSLQKVIQRSERS